jgi:hypothetical protein
MGTKKSGAKASKKDKKDKRRRKKIKLKVARTTQQAEAGVAVVTAGAARPTELEGSRFVVKKLKTAPGTAAPLVLEREVRRPFGGQPHCMAPNPPLPAPQPRRPGCQRPPCRQAVATFSTALA